MVVKMDIEEFIDELMEKGEYKCTCNVGNPPCTFCTDEVNGLYEEYLNIEEESK